MEGFWPATAIRQKERGKKRAHARAFKLGRGDRKTFSNLMLGLNPVLMIISGIIAIAYGIFGIPSWMVFGTQQR